MGPILTAERTALNLLCHLSGVATLTRQWADAIAGTIAKVGENMTLRRAAALSVGKGIVASYVHNSVADGLGRIGVIVALESTGNADELNGGRRSCECLP